MKLVFSFYSARLAMRETQLLACRFRLYTFPYEYISLLWTEDHYRHFGHMNGVGAEALLITSMRDYEKRGRLTDSGI